MKQSGPEHRGRNKPGVVGPRDCVGQGSENEVSVEEDRCDYFGICFS